MATFAHTLYTCHFQQHLVKGPLVRPRHDVVCGEHDIGSALDCKLRDDVDGGGLELDEEHLRLDALQLLVQSRSVREVARDVHDVGAVVFGEVRGEDRMAGRWGRAEVCDRPPADVAGRPWPQHRRDDRNPGRDHRTHRVAGARPAAALLAHRDDHEIGAEKTERVQVARGHSGVLVPSDDDDRPIGRNRGQRGSAPVEHDDVWREPDRDASSGVDVGGEDAARETSAAAPRTDGLDAGESSGLEVIGGGMTTGARELDERLDRRRHRDRLRLARSSAAHRHDDDSPVAREQAGEMARDGRLSHSLPGADHRDRRQLEGLEGGRLEPEIRALVRDALREDPAREREPLDRAEDGLVGEVDDDVRSELADPGVEVVDERDAVVLSASELLGTPDQQRRDEIVREVGQRVADDGRVVLAVDDRERSHVLAVTSASIAPVNFAYSSVSRENETSFTLPWNGCRRQTSTLRSASSMML